MASTLLNKYGVSLTQYRRAEQGSEQVSHAYLDRIAYALGLDVSVFTGSNYSPERDHRIPEIYQQAKQQYFYLSDTDYRHPDSFHTRNFLNLILCMPMFARDTLWRCLYNIGGKIIGNEEYVLTQASRLFAEIPDTKGKIYTEYVCEGICHIPLKDKIEEALWQEDYASRGQSAEMLDAYNEYLRQLNRFLWKNYFYDYNGGWVMATFLDKRGIRVALSIERLSLLEDNKTITSCVKDVLLEHYGLFSECNIYQNQYCAPQDSEFNTAETTEMKYLAELGSAEIRSRDSIPLPNEILCRKVLYAKLMGQEDYFASILDTNPNSVAFEDYFGDSDAKILLVLTEK